MFREQLSQAITTIANTVLPNAVGDEWRNENFTVLLPEITLLSNTVNCEDSWVAIAEVRGTASVRIFSDEGKTPVDPTLLLAELWSNPIVIKPMPNIDVGQYAIQLVWKPDTINDLLDEQEFIIPQISGPLSNSYLLRKISEKPKLPHELDIYVYAPRFDGCLPTYIGSLKKLGIEEMNQIKLEIRQTINSGLFSLTTQPEDNSYIITGESNVSFTDEKTFNESGNIQILRNGIHLNKGVAAIYIDPNCFRFIGTVDAGDYFTILLNPLGS